MVLLRVLVFGLGLAIVLRTLFSAVLTFVLPRSAPDRLVGLVFLTMRRLFEIRLWRVRDYLRRDAIMALYAPVSLLLLLPVWLTLILAGYTLMFWAVGITDWYEAFILSGSSLFTLGFARSDPSAHILLTFTESTIGLILVALLLAYLPTMYGAFSNREQAVTLLEVRAGSPPSAVEMILRFHRLGRLEGLQEVWTDWERWFAELQESHTSLAALVFFRSPNPRHSWVTAAGALLDGAALMAAVVDVPSDVQVNLCLRAGYLALRNIGDYFGIEHNANPRFPADPISVTRAEFDAACQRFTEQGIPLKPDREQAWQDFAGWRVNYDSVLIALCALIMAPPAPWSSDRLDRQVYAAARPLPPRRSAHKQ
jgi:hypothetical protein